MSEAAVVYRDGTSTRRRSEMVSRLHAPAFAAPGRRREICRRFEAIDPILHAQMDECPLDAYPMSRWVVSVSVPCSQFSLLFAPVYYASTELNRVIHLR